MRVRTTLLVLSVITGCDRAKTPEPRPATRDRTAVGGAVQSVGWDDALGKIVATPSVESGTPVLFVRDTAGTAGIQVELFSHDEHTVRAVLNPLAPRHACAWERSGELAAVSGQALSAPWSLALAPGIATPIAIDDIVELQPRDSAALVANIHRQVSAVPDDSAAVPFRGLPVVVRDAWLFHLEDSSAVAVAVAIRSLNLESSPRSEATTIIVEHAASWQADEWRTGFVQRVSGPEDRVEGADLLAAFRLAGQRTAVAFAREDESGLRLDIVERTAPATWRRRWSSGALSCER